jgi:hypothetical protein
VTATLGRLRHWYHGRFGRRGRIQIAVLLTIVVVTYLVVPWLTELVDAMRGYGPAYYEPKDFTRQDFIIRHGIKIDSVPAWKVALNVSLIFLVVLVWMTVLPTGDARRR